MSEEFPVSASHQLALIKSLPFVHTARHYYRSEGLVRPSDCGLARHGVAPARPAVTGRREEGKTGLSRGSKSRNKVSVGEAEEGSLPRAHAHTCTLSSAGSRSGTARRAATRPPPGATLAGGRYLLAAPASRPTLSARAQDSAPTSLHIPFRDMAPRLRRGSLTSHRTRPLPVGGLCPAQAGAGDPFADDPGLSRGILVGSAVPSLRSPEIHPPTLVSALPRRLGSAPPPHGLLTFSGVPCVLLMWIT